MVKPPPYGEGFSFALCASIETRGIRIYPLSLSCEFLPPVKKTYPQITYPLRSSHAAA